MTQKSKQLGTDGEDAAVRYLQMHGYTIVARNVHARIGEIDIIAQKQDVWHFVEVKTRRSARHGMPYEAVQPWKLQHLKKAAYAYLLREGIGLVNRMSMDVISIIMAEHDIPQIKHYQNIAVGTY